MKVVGTGPLNRGLMFLLYIAYALIFPPFLLTPPLSLVRVLSSHSPQDQPAIVGNDTLSNSSTGSYRLTKYCNLILLHQWQQ